MLELFKSKKNTGADPIDMLIRQYVAATIACISSVNDTTVSQDID